MCGTSDFGATDSNYDAICHVWVFYNAGKTKMVTKSYNLTEICKTFQISWQTLYIQISLQHRALHISTLLKIIMNMFIRTDQYSHSLWGVLLFDTFFTCALIMLRRFCCDVLLFNTFWRAFIRYCGLENSNIYIMNKSCQDYKTWVRVKAPKWGQYSFIYLVNEPNQNITWI